MSMSINNNYQAQMRYENNIGNQLKLEQMETAIKGPEVKAEKGFVGKDAVVKGGSNNAQTASLDRTGANINVEININLPAGVMSGLNNLGKEFGAAIANNDMAAAKQICNSSNFERVMQEAAGCLGSITGNSMDADINAIIQQVLRESYMETNQDLKMYAKKVQDFNAQKKVVREALQEMREARTSANKQCQGKEVAKAGGTADEKEPMTLNNNTSLVDAARDGLMKNDKLNSDDFKVVAQAYGIDLSKITNGDSFDDAITKMEETLSSIGDDAQLANTDLQNVMQKQQQYIQMMSNVSKMVHDTAMAIIRKIG